MRFACTALAVLAVPSVSGCDQVFGLRPVQHLPLIDAAYFDSIDGPPDAFCTVSKMTAAAEADGPIFQTLQTQGLSDLSLVNISGGLSDRALFRFDVSGFPPGYIALELHLAYAAHDNACTASNNCGSCDALEQAGDFQIYPVRSDWKERFGPDVGITWICRTGTSSCAPLAPQTVAQTWTSPGADGVDRGPLLGVMPHAAKTDSALKIAHQQLADTQMWIQGTKLSFEVVPANTAVGKFVVRAHEHTCDVGQPASQLVAVYCQ